METFKLEKEFNGIGPFLLENKTIKRPWYNEPKL